MTGSFRGGLKEVCQPLLLQPPAPFLASGDHPPILQLAVLRDAICLSLMGPAPGHRKHLDVPSVLSFLPLPCSSVWPDAPLPWGLPWFFCAEGSPVRVAPPMRTQ